MVLSGLWCLDNLPGPLGDRLWGWAIVLAGPFSALAYGVPNGCAPVALVTAPAILAHPLRPNVWTAMATAAAFVLWFLSGWLTLLVMAWGA